MEHWFYFYDSDQGLQWFPVFYRNKAIFLNLAFKSLCIPATVSLAGFVSYYSFYCSSSTLAVDASFTEWEYISQL